MEYSINDPYLHVDKISLLPTPQPCPGFQVYGYTGNPGERGSVEYQAAQVFAYITNTLSFVQKYLVKPLQSWSANNNLVSFPRAGVQLNAYYDRASLKFFYLQNPATQKIVYTCESSDIVCHELGHAVLDAMRPDLWNSPMLEVPAFHESFGDCVSILSALHYDEFVTYVIQQTDGDLRKRNAANLIAEEMGETVYSLSHGANGRLADALRCAVNDFVYVEPESLPNVNSDDKLSRASHNFSRVFTSAFYECVVQMYEEKIPSLGKIEALKYSREMIARIFLNAASVATLTPRFYNSVTTSMLVIDQQLGGYARNAIVGAFSKKNIIDKDRIPLLFGAFMHSNNVETVKINDYVDGSNPLYKHDVEVPKLLGFSGEPDEEILQSTKVGLDHIAATDKFSYNDKDKEFSVEDGKLIRNFFTSH